MATYKIYYNPYTNTSTIEKNGVELKKNGVLRKGIGNKRLQAWFDADKSWEGFCKALDKDNNGKKCHIEFVGREVDYIDLKDFFENVYVSENSTEFSFSSKFVSSDKEMLAKLLDLVQQLKKEELFEPKQMDAIERSVRDIRENPFVISVLATMSSGKSTLLNALMHQELLPTGDDATTAKIVEIFDNDKEEITFEAYDEEGELVKSGDNADLELISSLNDTSGIRRVKIYGDIPGVDTEKMQLMLRDTPGPNNSSDITHRQITHSIIENGRDLSTVIYVMNGIDLRVDSDRELLDAIAKEMHDGGKQANDRFLFVINKVDLRLKKKEQTLEKLIDDTRVYLSEFNIENPRIFPITAGLACDIYKCRSGYEFDELVEWPDVEKNLRMFNADSDRVKFDLYASTSPSVKRQLEADLLKAIEENDEQEIALIHSGVKGLEYSIREYVDKYAYPIKVSDAVKEIVETVNQEQMIGRLTQIIQNDSQECEKLKEEVRGIEEKKAERLATRKKFEDIIDNYTLPDDVKRSVDQSVNESFQSIIDDFLSKITGEKLRRIDAESQISMLEIRTHEAERKFDREIKEIIHRNVFEQGNNIIDSFKAYIQSIEEDIKIDYFNYGDVKELKKFDFMDMKSVARKVTSVDTIKAKKSKEIPNPDRHWYTPWRSKTIWIKVDVPVGQVEYVDKKEIRDDALSIAANAQENAAEIVQEAIGMIEEFKVYFKSILDEFDEIIDSIISRLKAVTAEADNTEKDKEFHEDQLVRLEKCIEAVNNITKFEGEQQ